MCEANILPSCAKVTATLKCDCERSEKGEGPNPDLHYSHLCYSHPRV